MIILGIVLLIAGFVFKISILWTIGIVLLVIGVVLMVMGRMGHAVGGRRTLLLAIASLGRRDGTELPH